MSRLSLPHLDRSPGKHAGCRLHCHPEADSQAPLERLDTSCVNFTQTRNMQITYRAGSCTVSRASYSALRQDIWCSPSAVLWRASRLTIYTWGIVLEPSQARRSVSLLCTTLRLRPTLRSEPRQKETVITVFLKGNFYSAQTRHNHKWSSCSPLSHGFCTGWMVSLFFGAAPLSPLLLCSLWSFSVQQCPSEHEDPAAEPDGFDGELGTSSDHLPPTHHQLHGLLQLGEARRRRWEDIHQNCGPENSEYHRMPLKNQTKPLSLPPPILALCFRFKQFPFFFLGNLRCMWQDQKVAGSVTVCRGGDRLWWTLLVAVGWYEGPDTPLSLTCLRIDT